LDIVIHARIGKKVNGSLLPAELRNKERENVPVVKSFTHFQSVIAKNAILENTRKRLESL
jgi:hypothetical protein